MARTPQNYQKTRFESGFYPQLEARTSDRTRTFLWHQLNTRGTDSDDVDIWKHKGLLQVGAFTVDT